jgi:hypothetical protein
MCGGACVYIMLPQQRMYKKDIDERTDEPERTSTIQARKK